MTQLFTVICAYNWEWSDNNNGELVASPVYITVEHVMYNTRNFWQKYLDFSVHKTWWAGALG